MYEYYDVPSGLMDGKCAGLGNILDSVSKDTEDKTLSSYLICILDTFSDNSINGICT